MDDIQSWWEVPSIAHFCSLFRAAFNLLDFDIEELEEALLTDGTEDAGSSLLQELIVRLLCGCVADGHNISVFNYQMFLRRLFRKKCKEYGRQNPFNTDMDLQFLPLRKKVEILHALCDFRLDGEDVQDLLKNLESDSLRVEALGQDQNSSAYWYFYGTRLYREDFPKVQRKKKERKQKRGRHSSEDEVAGLSTWSVVCYTEQDWESLTSKFQDSEDPAEKALYHTLAVDFLPEIPRLFQEKERLQMKRLMEYQPRRTSSRINKLNKQKEAAMAAAEAQRKGDSDNDEETNRRSRQQTKTSADVSEIEEEDTQSSSGTRRQLRKDRQKRALRGDLSGGEGSEESPASMTRNKRGSRKRPSTPIVTAPLTPAPVGRQTNNSLASATGTIFIQSATPTPSSTTSSKSKLRSSQVFAQSEEDLQTGMYKILERLKSHPDSWPFCEPVEEIYAPRYYAIVSKPMDLHRMERKLDSGRYLTFGEFKADFKLIVDNCKKYNGSENEYTEMVENLDATFERAASRYLDVDFSSDEEIAIQFPPAPSPKLASRSPSPLPASPTISHNQERGSRSRSAKKNKKHEEVQESRNKHIHSKNKRRSRRRDDDISPEPSPPAQRPETPPSPPPSPKPVHPPVGPFGRRRAGPPPPPSKAPLRRRDRRSGRRGSDESAPASGNEMATNEDELSDGDRENVHVGRKREAPRHAGNARKRKKTAVKNTAAIEALELATEQTLKDINKWLDDTPKFSEFSSASNSPSHYLGASNEEFHERRNIGHHIGATVGEEETRGRQQRTGGEKQRRTKPSNTSALEAIKERRKKEVQRTIERLQPGKSKGNLIANLPKPKTEEGSGGGLGDAANNASAKSIKEKNNTLTKTDEATPKLSLGSVLKTSIGGFNDAKPVQEDNKDSEPETEVKEKDSKEETKELLSPVKPQVKSTVPDSNKATPNLSAWFKAFGAPKAAPCKKKVEPEPAVSKPETKPSETISEQPESKSTEVFQSSTAEKPARHRNLSAGNNVSDLPPAFSQDMEMSEVVSPRDRLSYHQSPPAMSPASPRIPPPPIQPTQHFPINGTIKVGFYQDTSSQKSSPDKSSPREEVMSVPTPQTTPTYPQYTPPPAHSYPTISNPTPAYEQSSPIPIKTQFTSTPSLQSSQPPPSQSQNYNQSDIQYYDTSKPLTDQYRDRQPSPPKVMEQQTSQQQQQQQVLPEYVRSQPASPVPIATVHQEYSKLQQQQLHHHHQQYPQTPIATPAYLNANTTIKSIPPVIIPQRNMPNNLIIPPVPQPQPPPQPDPKVMQQYPVKKRMVYTSSSSNEYTGIDVSAYQNQQRIVSHPSLGIPYYDPTSGTMLHQPPYDLSTQVMKETPPPPAPAPAAPPAKPKRGRKKATATVNSEPTKVPENIGTAFQHYMGLSTKEAMSLKPSVPGSAFNFGAPGLTIPTRHPLYNPTDKDAAYYAAGYRNYYDNKLKAPQVSSPNMIPSTSTTSPNTTTQQQTQCIGGPTSPQSPFSFLGQPPTASRAPPQSHAHQYQQSPLPPAATSTDTPTYHQFQQVDQKSVSAVYYHHQFSQGQISSTFVPPYSPSPPQQVTGNTQTSQASNRPPPPPPHPATAFMMESSPLYQQYFQRHPEDLLLQQRQLHQGLLGPPTGYPPGHPYHPSLGIRQPFDGINRPAWL